MITLREIYDILEKEKVQVYGKEIIADWQVEQFEGRFTPCFQLNVRLQNYRDYDSRPSWEDLWEEIEGIANILQRHCDVHSIGVERNAMEYSDDNLSVNRFCGGHGLLYIKTKKEKESGGET